MNLLSGSRRINPSYTTRIDFHSLDEGTLTKECLFIRPCSVENKDIIGALYLTERESNVTIAIDILPINDTLNINVIKIVFSYETLSTTIRRFRNAFVNELGKHHFSIGV